jgi:RluA family pseudouridine synthase
MPIQAETDMAKKKHATSRRLPRGLEILYEDKAILVVEKPAGLLTMGTATNKSGTAYYILTDYVRKGSVKSPNRLFIVHRLDQSTSGVLVFAKSQEVKLWLQAHWEDVQKEYIAVVHGKLTPGEGTITSYLAENKAYVVYSTADASKGKLAKTAYRVLKERGRFSLVEIDLLTGRKNQIRVHMADRGHPVVGDRRYGDAKDGYKRLALHALKISFMHPTTREQMTFETKIPAFVKDLIGMV